ncbi:hypothetical protein MKW94_006898 [Papaver nudicaule]|uniref:Glycosyltransferase n=1 Tax=Papaver nudicaule TaxID=74823 RepID=A0AA41RNB5_PAPNU|nr:hypothetical protein [Papaver nudicaule]
MVRGSENHVLVLPYPGQGHINPMLQFSKRLISKGLKVTLAITVHVAKTMETQIDGPIKVEKISDRHDEGGMMQASSVRSYIERYKLVGSEALSKIIEKQRSLGDPISCVVYHDQFYPWALHVAKRYNLIGAAFYTQSCVVSSIYYDIQKGLLKTPVLANQVSSRPGLPTLDFSDLPTYIADLGPDPAVLDAILEPYRNSDKADWVLFSTFDKLEVEVNNMNFSTTTCKQSDQLPSAYLDKRIEGDTNYGFNMFEPKVASCISWLNSKKNHSVIYLSFGSISMVKQEQMEEIAWALLECDYNFLWVVRGSEENKIPSKFLKQMSTSERGKMLSWCPQLEVLSHPAVGCFATHCGWNSTLEALSIGVPMIGFPVWSDQPTNAKCIEDVWKVGIRPKFNKNRISRKEDVKSCIQEVMEGVKGKEMRMNARKWKNLAVEAVREGGSSDKNIDEFVAKVNDFNMASPQCYRRAVT